MFVPDLGILERYARLLVEFALDQGNGIKEGDVVEIHGSEACKPLYVETCKAVWRAGGHVIHRFMPSEDEYGDVRRAFYELAGESQLDFFPGKYLRGVVDEVDHSLHILAPADLHAMDGIDPSKQMRHQRSRMPALEWEQEKENAGEFSWTVATYPTPALAAEARMSIEEYWQQVIKACFLELENPVARWREVRSEIAVHRERLNALPIERLHVEGADADLWLTLGEQRRWMDGVGTNLPSFEIFTSPDWRGTEGWMRFSEPLYAFGSLITGVELEFKDGRVTRARADENQRLLREMIASDNADRVGEFSLTDARLSPIDRFMADTLYDENMGGPYGNTHIAVGESYKDTYDGDPAPLTDADWERLGFNHSAIHTDFVSTTDRTVTAALRDGSKLEIYAGGHFQLDSVAP
jgi:aminopeptidase